MSQPVLLTSSFNCIGDIVKLRAIFQIPWIYIMRYVIAMTDNSIGRYRPAKDFI